ncbi:MAG: hypothetical protein O3B43_05120 [Chloroflexi bacterium]|nr:hypothetical protein [Chloroflexota bacterium]
MNGQTVSGGTRNYVKKVFFLILKLVVVAVIAAFLLGRRTLYGFAEVLTWIGFLAVLVGASGPLGIWNSTRTYYYAMASSASFESSKSRLQRENDDLESSYAHMAFWILAGLGTVALAALIHKILQQIA